MELSPAEAEEIGPGVNAKARVPRTCELYNRFTEGRLNWRHKMEANSTYLMCAKPSLHPRIRYAAYQQASVLMCNLFLDLSVPPWF